MKQFTSHIDFLLQKHDCVIIPDFGGFILNREQAYVLLDGSINPPSIVVGFNPELKYNDGLLVGSYMNAFNLSYDAACKKVRENVNKLNNALLLGQQVQIGHLGSIRLDENNQMRFTTNPFVSLSHPETFGLSSITIKPLSHIAMSNIATPEIEQGIAKEKVSLKFPFKTLITGATGVAAALFIFFGSSTPIDQNKNIQQSSFFSKNLLTTSVEPSVIASNQRESAVEEIIEEQEDNSLSSIVEEKTFYYIIVGSAKSQTEANRILLSVQQKGYQNSDILESDKRRYRIYVSSFENKNEAENFLLRLKRSKPEYKDAWLFID